MTTKFKTKDYIIFKESLFITIIINDIIAMCNDRTRKDRIGPTLIVLMVILTIPVDTLAIKKNMN